MRSYKPRKCAKCGVEFQPTAARQYCSETCRVPFGEYIVAYRGSAEARARRRQKAGIIDAPGEDRWGACGVEGCPYNGQLHLDHWHDGPYKGRVRGWLCPNHNRGIGQLGDSVDGLKRSLDYLLACEAREASHDVSNGEQQPLATNQES